MPRPAWFARIQRDDGASNPVAVLQFAEPM